MGKSWSNEKSFFPLILSIIFLLHLGALLIHLTFDSETKKRKTADTEKPIKVRIIDVKKQIVQSRDSKDRRVKDKAFLSDKTRSFNRQTRSRVTDIFHEGSKGGGRRKQGKKDLKLSDLGSMVGDDPFKKAAKDYSKQKNGDGESKQSRKVSSTNDYLEKIPLGDMTELNTVEYKFYGFYFRIRQKLEQFWGRSLEQKAKEIARQGRKIAAEEEMITALQITLDKQGEILAIKVLGSSGVQELDDAAIESFNDAGPFPNPPKGLIVDGKVTLEWGFVVKS